MKKIIYVVIFLVLMISVNALIDVKIDIKKEFKINEQVNFNFTIISDIDQQIIFMPHSQCPNAPTPFLEKKNINLIANQPHTDTYYDIIIDDSIESQTCTAYIEILEPIQQKVEKSFEIKTNPSFKFDINIGKKIFILNENVNIKYNSEVENPEITSTLIFPNKKTKTISLPYSFKPKQLGTYNLEVTASKKGYKTITKTEQFGVIEKEADIPYVGEKEKEEYKKEYDTLFYIILIILLFIIIFIIYKYKPKKRNR